MGKGSGRRVEDLTKVHEGYSRIFGESKLEKRLREEREALEEEAECSDEEEDDTCSSCGGPLYTQPHWAYSKCDDCGRTVTKEYDV